LIMTEWIDIVEWTDALSERVNACDGVLVDVDDVVLTPDNYFIGSTVWAGYHFSKHASSHSYAELIGHFYQALDAVAFKAVDPALNAFLSTLAQTIPVLGLTARMPVYAEKTLQQCNSVGMHFTGQTIPGLVQDGLISAGYNNETLLPNDKGAAVLKWIGAGNDTLITRLAAIDDSRANLKIVGQALDAIGIHFVAIHYTQVARDLDNQYTRGELNLLASLQFSALQNQTACTIPSNAAIITADACLIEVG
ncbi:MAG TPA: DUF2608 domain-containing protein, partial [Opitutales bacterium]|nr:DUF2608 domain-containing protein [Opitutales bacterium]